MPLRQSDIFIRSILIENCARVYCISSLPDHKSKILPDYHNLLEYRYLFGPCPRERSPLKKCRP